MSPALHWSPSSKCIPETPRGLVATNAAASIAATDKERARKFLDELWKAEVPSSVVFRYYDGLLYMMSLMHVTGDFRIIMPKAGP